MVENKFPDNDKTVFTEERRVATHSGVLEQIEMNKYHLILVLERLKKGSKIPSYGDACPWVGLGLAFLLALIPADFKDFLELSAATWQAIAIILMGASFLKAGHVLWQAWKYRDERTETPEEAVQKIVAQMTEDQKKLSKT